MTIILAGDIGGTNTRLALVDVAPGGKRILFETTFPSRERTSLEAALEEFLSLHRVTFTRASFGIAGPVRADAAKPRTSPGWSTRRAWRSGCA